MLLRKNFSEKSVSGNDDPFKNGLFSLLRDMNYIFANKKIGEETARRARLFVILIYTLAEDTSGLLCVDYESKIPRLSVDITYPGLKCVGFEGKDLKTFTDLLEVSTKVIICPPEAEDEDVMLIFEHDML